MTDGHHDIAEMKIMRLILNLLSSRAISHPRKVCDVNPIDDPALAKREESRRRYLAACDELERVSHAAVKAIESQT